MSPIKPEDSVKLYEYFQVCFEVQLKPFLEIYSYNPPDPLACVEHQCREFAYRVQVHPSPRNSPEDTIPPLLPIMRRRK